MSEGLKVLVVVISYHPLLLLSLQIQISFHRINIPIFWLQILEKVKIAYDIPIVTDVHESIQVSSFTILYSLVLICLVEKIFFLVCWLESNPVT